MFGKEPAVVFKVIEEIIRAAIPMALIFSWVQWTEAQTGAVLLFVGVLIGGVSLLLTRSQVVPVDKADEQIKTALKMAPDTKISEVKNVTEERMS